MLSLKWQTRQFARIWYELAQFSFRVTDVFQLTSKVYGEVGKPQVIATIWFWPGKRMHGQGSLVNRYRGIHYREETTLPAFRIEQNRIEQNRIEQNRIEQNRIEQNRIIFIYILHYTYHEMITMV